MPLLQIFELEKDLRDTQVAAGLPANSQLPVAPSPVLPLKSHSRPRVSRPPIIVDDFSEMSSDSEMDSPEHPGMVYYIHTGVVGIDLNFMYWSCGCSCGDIFRNS